MVIVLLTSLTIVVTHLLWKLRVYKRIVRSQRGRIERGTQACRVLVLDCLDRKDIVRTALYLEDVLEGRNINHIDLMRDLEKSDDRIC